MWSYNAGDDWYFTKEENHERVPAQLYCGHAGPEILLLYGLVVTAALRPESPGTSLGVG